MSTKPILFASPMVRALLDGRKSQTRRLLKNQEIWNRAGDAILRRWPRQMAGVPYAPGDLLWVRETWMKSIDAGPHLWLYAADWGAEGIAYYRALQRWRSPMHMPRSASRLTLEVTDVRVQRLQDISGEDAIAEGIQIPRCGCEVCAHSAGMCPADQSEAVIGFASLWRDIHGEGAWEANPWVVALTFNVNQRNVDALLSERATA